MRVRDERVSKLPVIQQRLDLVVREHRNGEIILPRERRLHRGAACPAGSGGGENAVVMPAHRHAQHAAIAIPHARRGGERDLRAVAVLGAVDERQAVAEGRTEGIGAAMPVGSRGPVAGPVHKRVRR